MQKKIQTSIIVTTGGVGSGSNSRLNGMLENGWRVLTMCGMPSSCMVTRFGPDSSSNAYVEVTDHPPTCLVILEKDEVIVTPPAGELPTLP